MTHEPPGGRGPTPEGFRRTTLGLWVPDAPGSPAHDSRDQQGFGLWLPTGLTAATPDDLTPAQEFLERNTRLVLGARDLLGLDSSLNEVIRRLEQYSLEHVMAMIARIDAALHAGEGRDGEGTRQLEIAVRIFAGRQVQLDASLARAAQAHGANAPVLFHGRQLLNLAKVALLALPLTTTRDGEPPPEALGEALLMMSDLIEPESGHIVSIENRRRLELYVFANSLYNRTPNAVHDLARGYDFFLRRHPRLNGPHDPDMAAWVERLTGLTPEAVWAGLFIFFGWFFRLKLSQLDKRDFILDTENFFSNVLGMSSAEREQMFVLVAAPAEEMRDEVRTRYTLDDLQPFDVLPFAKRPLIRFGRPAYALSIPLLQQLAGPGLQYRFLDHAHTTKSERDRFLEFRGRLVEDAVGEVLARTFGERHIDESEILARAGGQQSCDHIVWSGDTVVLLECKASMVRNEVRVAVDWELFLELLQKTYVEAADQLLSTVRLLKTGTFSDLGVEPRLIRRYLPVVITFELPATPFTYDVLMNEGLAGHGLLIEALVAPLQNMELDELELAERAAEDGYSFAGLIEEKADAPGGAGQPFRNYWHHAGKPFPGPRWHNRHLEARYEELARGAVQFLKSRGLRPDPHEVAEDSADETK